MKKVQAEHISIQTEQTHNHRDSRVIHRERGILQYMLEAKEEHINALLESLKAVRNSRDKIQLQISALNKVLAKRVK